MATILLAVSLCLLCHVMGRELGDKEPITYVYNLRRAINFSRNMASLLVTVSLCLLCHVMGRELGDKEPITCVYNLRRVINFSRNMAILLLTVSLCLLCHVMGRELGDKKPITQPGTDMGNNCTTDGRNVNVYCHCDGKASGKGVACQTDNVGKFTAYIKENILVNLYVTDSSNGRNVNVYCHCDGKASGKGVACQTGSVGESNAVTQPPPTLVAFSVGGTNRFAPGTPTRIPFNVVFYNDGRYFHTDNAFYAPFNGVYAFTYSALTEGSKWVQTTLYTQKPGEAKVAVAKSPQYNHGTGSGSVMIKLEAGESVSVWTGGAADIVAGNTPPTTLFMGELKQRL